RRDVGGDLEDGGARDAGTEVVGLDLVEREGAVRTGELSAARLVGVAPTTRAARDVLDGHDGGGGLAGGYLGRQGRRLRRCGCDDAPAPMRVPESPLGWFPPLPDGSLAAAQELRASVPAAARAPRAPIRVIFTVFPSGMSVGCEALGGLAADARKRQ